MKRPFKDSRPVGPLTEGLSFMQFEPKDNIFTLDFFIKNSVYKAKVQEKNRINIPKAEVDGIDIDEDDLVRVRMFRLPDSVNVTDELDGTEMSNILDEKKQAIYGAKVQKRERINIPNATAEMLDISIGDSVLVILEKTDG